MFLSLLESLLIIATFASLRLSVILFGSVGKLWLIAIFASLPVRIFVSFLESLYRLYYICITASRLPVFGSTSSVKHSLQNIRPIKRCPILPFNLPVPSCIKN